MKECRDMCQIPKLKTVWVGRKQTLSLFIGMFVGVLLRETDVLPLGRITMLYCSLSEVAWMCRYNDGNMAPRNENFFHAG